MYAAVAQLAVVHVDLLCLLAHLLGEAGQLLALFLRCHYLREHHVAYLRVLVQEVVELLLYKVADELLHAHAAGVGCYGGGTEPYLCLALEYRFLYVYGYGCDDSVAYVAVLEVLCREEVVYGECDKLLERALVCSAL